MTAANYDDVLQQLLDAGLKPDTVKSERGGHYIGALVVNGANPCKCFTKDDERERRGWYWLSTIDLPDQDRKLQTYIIGAFGINQGADHGKQAVKLNRAGAPALTAEESRAIRERQAAQAKAAKAMRAAEAAKAAAIADAEWRRFLPTGESSYLKRKGVQAYGLRFSPDEDTVAVPMQRAGRIVGLLLIRGKDRGTQMEKQNWPRGIDMADSYHLIGGIPRGLILVTEGYATGATLHEATGLPVAITFSAGRLECVIAALVKAHRGVRILICADDDYLTPGNPGVEAARLAAAAHGAEYFKPEFSEERSTTKKGPTDFNDLHQLEGLQAVRQQVASRLDSLGWAIPAAREIPNGGQGETPAKKPLASLLSVGEACERFALVYGGKGSLFDHQEHVLVPKGDVLDIIQDHGWREWKLREDRQVVRLSEVGFDPACTDSAIRCNLWGGWPTEPKEGNCEQLLLLLRMLLSDEKNSADLYTWVLRWLAYPIQHPGAKMRTALIIHGLQGTGKNLFFETIMEIYGEYGRIVDQAAIEDKFNDWASRKLFLIADEVVARQELYHVKNRMKSFVTGEWIRINPKSVAAHDEKNHCNIVYLSNETQPLPIDPDDRRHFVVWTPIKLEEESYHAVRDELRAGGRAALHHYLLNLDLGDMDEHSKPPMTKAKADLIAVSSGNVHRFVTEWLGGDVYFDNVRLPICPCGSSDLYSAYLRWCRENGVRNPRESNQFISEIAKLPGWWRGLKDRLDNLHDDRSKVRWRFVIPSADVLNEAAKLAADSDYRKKDGETDAKWLGGCFFAFRQVLGVQK